MSSRPTCTECDAALACTCCGLAPHEGSCDLRTGLCSAHGEDLAEQMELAIEIAQRTADIGVDNERLLPESVDEALVIVAYTVPQDADAALEQIGAQGLDALRAPGVRADVVAINGHLVRVDARGARYEAEESADRGAR